MMLRWWQRGGRTEPTIEQAWSEGIDVAIPGRRDIDAKLHKETGTVIARHGKGPGTVFDSDNMVLYKDNSLVCGN